MSNTQKVCYNCGRSVKNNEISDFTLKSVENTEELDILEEKYEFLIDRLDLVHCLGPQNAFIEGIPITCKSCFDAALKDWGGLKKPKSKGKEVN